MKRVDPWFHSNLPVHAHVPSPSTHNVNHVLYNKIPMYVYNVLWVSIVEVVVVVSGLIPSPAL